MAESHALYDIAGDTPPQTAALYRLLIAILLRVYRPAADDFAVWQEMWRSLTWDMDRINAYLDEWRHRFDLFATGRRFYQSDSDDSRVAPNNHQPQIWQQVSVIILCLTMTTTQGDRRYLRQEAARDLITVQAFGFGWR
ncbi:MAG: type I-E CRISPR-associated protein Cse1/CasA [Candidatus Promineofilum sp.]|nr:type I-E CRISPR-associated protein Cse1/CasA [Promineifilum sp.]